MVIQWNWGKGKLLGAEGERAEYNTYAQDSMELETWTEAAVDISLLVEML